MPIFISSLAPDDFVRRLVIEVTGDEAFGDTTSRRTRFYRLHLVAVSKRSTWIATMTTSATYAVLYLWRLLYGVPRDICCT